jgi:hypothetical protein
MGKVVREETHRFYSTYHDAFWDVDATLCEIEVEDFTLPEKVFVEKLNATYRLKHIQNRKVFIRMYDGS